MLDLTLITAYCLIKQNAYDFVQSTISSVYL